MVAVVVAFSGYLKGSQTYNWLNQEKVLDSFMHRIVPKLRQAVRRPAHSLCLTCK